MTLAEIIKEVKGVLAEQSSKMSLCFLNVEPINSKKKQTFICSSIDGLNAMATLEHTEELWLNLCLIQLESGTVLEYVKDKGWSTRKQLLPKIETLESPTYKYNVHQN